MASIGKTERQVLGWLSFLFCSLPVIFLVAVFAELLFEIRWPESFFKVGLLATIISVGLQLALWVMLAEAAGDEVPESAKSIFLPRHPFWLFEFWWRYVRIAHEKTQSVGGETERSGTSLTK